MSLTVQMTRSIMGQDEVGRWTKGGYEGEVKR